MTELRLQVTGKSLVITQLPVIISGEINATECYFTFDSSWDGAVKTAVFFADKNVKAYAVLNNDYCEIPWEQVKDAGQLYIGVFSVKGNESWGTNFARLVITNGASPTGLSLIPTESVYVQIVNIMDQQARDAQLAVDKAAEAADSAVEAKTSEDNAKTSEDNAKASEDNAKASEDHVIEIEGVLQGTVDNSIAATNAANTAASNAQTVANTYAGQVSALQTQLTQAVGAITVDSEVVLARNGFVTLDGRLDDSDTKLNTLLNEEETAVLRDFTGPFISYPEADDCVVELTKVEGAYSQTVTTQGRNICPTAFSEWESGQYDMTGVMITDANRIRTKRKIPVLPSTTYYVNTNDTDGSFVFAFSFRAYGADGVFKRNISSIVDGGTFTTNADEYYIGINIYDSASGTPTYTTFSNDFTAGTIKPYICLNSEALKTYEAFTPNSPSPDYPAAISQSTNFDVVSSKKNLFVKNLTSITTNSITVASASNESYVVTGTSSASPTYIVTLKTLGRSLIKAGFYIISLFNSVVDSSISVRLRRDNGSSKTDIVTFPLNSVNKTYTIDLLSSISSDTIKVDLDLVFTGSGVTYNTTLFPQIEYGQGSSTYEQYTFNKLNVSYELRKLPNGICDTVEKKSDGKWYYIQRVGKVVLNGSEAWILASTDIVTLRFSLNTSAIYSLMKIFATDVTNNVASGSFKTYSQIGLPDTEGVSTHSTQGVQFRINKSRLSALTVAGFQTWLTSNNVTVYYELATYVETLLPEQKLLSYKGLTNVFTTSAQTPNLNVSFRSTLKNIYSKIDTKVALADIHTQTGTSINTDRADDEKVELTKIEGASYQDLSVWGTNLITNGSFVSGTGWPTTRATGSIASNILTITSDTTLGEHYADQLVSNAVVGHIYHYAANLNTLANSRFQIRILNRKSDGSYEQSLNTVTTTGRISIRITPTSVYSTPEIRARLQITDSTGGYLFTGVGNEALSVSYVSLFDLTEIFGAGKEPSQAQFDAMLLAISTNSWFDGKGKITTDIVTYTQNSPSPDYPATITNANNFDVVACGKNLVISAEYPSSARYGDAVKADIITLLPNTNYTLSLIIPSGESYYCNEYLFVNGGATVLTGDGTRKSITLTTLANITKDSSQFSNGKWKILKNNSATNTSGTASALQIELGSTVTTYELYKSNKLTIPYELRKLPNGVCDTIEKQSDGKWYYVQRVGKVVLTSANILSLTTTGINADYVTTDKAFANAKAWSLLTLDTVVCDKFVEFTHSGGSAWDYTSSVGKMVSANASGNYLIFFVAKGYYSSLADAQTKLLNTVIHYELATPVTTAITFDAVLTSYKSITNLLSTANPQPLMTSVFKSRLKNSVEVMAGMPATNLVQNSDFSNGTVGFIASSSNITASNSTLSIVGNGTSATMYAYQTLLGVLASHKYYIRAKMMVTNSICTSMDIRLTFGYGTNTTVITKTTPTINTWNVLSGIFAQTDQTGAIAILMRHSYADNASALNATMQIQCVSVLDITEIFGAGNEPSLAEMDLIMSKYPNSWFRDTVNPLLTHKELMAYLNKNKANTKQEDWITPTLTNGWVAFDVARTPQYMKDSMGFVHLRGSIKSGTLSASVFTLPIGYRPKTYCNFAVSSNGAYGNCQIDNPGSVIPNVGNTTGFILDSISFKAEA